MVTTYEPKMSNNPEENMP